MTSAAPRIDAKTLKAIIGDKDELAIIDVREDGQFGLSHLLLAVPVPYSVLEARIIPLVPRRATRVVLIDAGDGVADKAAARLAAMGYGEISILDGGVESWNAAGFELFMGVNVPSKAFAEVVEHECGTPAISAEELQAMFDAGDDLVVLDSRTPAEFKRMSIPNGVNCPGAELAYRAHDLIPSPDSLVVVNCAGRTRSIIGAQSLINAGVPNKVVALRGGTQGWVLAGYELDRGQTRGYGPVSPDGAREARATAARVKARYGVTAIDHDTLAAWRSEDRTLFLFDVRDEDSYKAGHIPGSVSAPGGQLVQAMDLKAATRNGRVILIDDTEIHATMTAHWLLQMGWDAYILEGGLGDAALETGVPAPESYEIPGEAPIETITPSALAQELENGDAVAIDTDISLEYREAHLPGAVWGSRARLPQLISNLPTGQKIVLYSEHETRARLAVSDVRALTDAPVAILQGGREAWKKAGLPTEATPNAPKDEDCIDFLFWVHDRHMGNEESMRGYLAWEEQLPAQIKADGDAPYRIVD
ncbi:MAG: thiosulfate sulfurtransferase [Rhodospirillaceae bacterium]|jgi:rhodanese-related sulfurtransferase|nr:thiosulfate sulfurtransferase [Rhodospirillaceae bacterium]MBT5665236.1 thiosulfate sulfurtransferase [Rhodospirillaceae bacterium]MBT5809587.1 thiosulfate sulfurtransferase [Rhodospirillaceae bacterium]